MGSIFSTVHLESESCDKPSTSDACDASIDVPATFPKLSSNALSSLELLSSSGSEWVDLGIFLAIGEELGNHGTVDEGRYALLSAIIGLHRERLVEFLGGSGYCRIRATPGTTLTQMWLYPNEETYYNVGCRMLFVGMGLMYGQTHLRVRLNACIESALEIAGDPEPRMRDHVRETLRAGFRVLARALGPYGYNRTGDELRMISTVYALSPETNKGPEKANVADDDIGLYGARMWIGRDDL